MCGYVLLSSMSSLSLSRAVLCCVLSVLSQVYFHVIRLSSRVTKFENFDVETLVFLRHVLFENRPPFEGNNSFKSQIFRRVVKFGKCAIQNFQTGLVSSTLCQNFRLSYQVHSCCQQNVGKEGCEGIGPISS